MISTSILSASQRFPAAQNWHVSTVHLIPSRAIRNTSCLCFPATILSQKEWGSMQATLILFGGRVTTKVGWAAEEAEAIACRGEHVLAVGSDEDIRALAGPGCELIPLQGRRVTPGLIDSHLHLSWLGMGLTQLDLVGVSSLGRLQEQVAARTARTPAGSWVLGRGWDQEVMGRLPSRLDLDAVAPAHPVLLVRVCGHVAVANSLALCLAGVNRDTPDPQGGVIDRDREGEPTGVLREEAMELVRSRMPVPNREEMAQALTAAGERVVAGGITSVHSNDSCLGQGPEYIPAAYRRARELGLRVRVWWDIPADLAPQVIERGWHSGQGDHWFRSGSLKFFADGSLGGATAALSAPYADQPSSQGVLTVDPEGLCQEMMRARRAGWQVAIHAIGDRAIEVALDAIEASQAEAASQAQAASQAEAPSQAGWRPRLIHAQVMRPDLFLRLARSRAVADLQPRFVSSDKRFVEARLGCERSRYAYAWRTFLEHGIPVAFGSDCPVEPIEPMLGVYAAVTRCDTEGQPPGGWHPEQKLSVGEAMRGFTLGAAYAVGEEGEKGSLEPGKLADLVVWEEDPFSVDPMALKDVRPFLTVVGGEVVYSR